MGEDEGASTNGHEGALLAGVGLLQFREVLNELDRLGLFPEHVIYTHTAWNDQNIVFFQILVGVFEVDVSFNDKTGG